LYRHDLATYDEGDVFDQSTAVGFIHLWGLPARTQTRVQGIGEAEQKEPKVLVFDSGITKKLEALTAIELRILDYIAYGMLNKQIANELNIDEKAVISHINSIYNKIKVSAPAQEIFGDIIDKVKLRVKLRVN
jgi:DNA-binding NarL/FixJ family response regulator